MTVVGLGPAGPELTTRPAIEALASCSAAFVRTRRHPAAAGLGAPGCGGADGLGSAVSFDDLYESASSMDEVYQGIVEALVGRAGVPGEVVYAVPGSPMVLERSVALLRADDRIEVELIAGMSFLDLAWSRLGVDPVSAGVRLVDGEEFAVDAAGERGPLLVAQCWSPDVLSGIKLSVEEYPSEAVTVLWHLGLPEEAVFEVAWADLDRVVEPDHLTTLWVPTLAAPVGVELARLTELARTLRQRCPWDRDQTHASLSRHLIEETYEVVEAIDALDAGGSFGHLEEELGDLLFQICFHCTLAAEQGQFNLADVATGVHDKLVGRHPHVFGSVTALSAGQVASNWEQIKQHEKGRTSVMDGIPAALPALLAASKVLGKATATGADRRDLGDTFADLAKAVAAVARLGEPAADGAAVGGAAVGGAAADGAAVGEPAAGGAAVGGAAAGSLVGEALLALVGVARRLDVDSEGALRQAVDEYRRHFEASSVA